MPIPHRPVPLLAVTFALALACGREPVPTHHVPPVDPTQVVKGDPDYKQRRKDFHEQMHRAPPDVDVAAVERRNGLAQIAKRNGLAALSAAADSRWTEKGSDNLAGRMHVAVPSPDGSSLYAGSSKGGVWRGLPDGSGWTALGDNLYGGAHWLSVLPPLTPGDPPIILAATDGGSVHRSDDDGATWTVPVGLPDAAGCRRVLTPADGSGTVFVLLRWWNNGWRHTLYRSTDGAQSFTKSLGMNAYEGDVWMPRDGDGTLYALKQDELQTSVDGGDTWVTVGTLPVATSGGELTGSEAGAPTLWAVVDAGGDQLYRSDDGGVTWSFVTAVSDYWGSLNASTVDPDLFAWGGVEVHVTRDGGGSFDIVNAWWEYYGQEATKLHADIPGIDVVPDGAGGETWYVATDGGLFASTDGLTSVSNLSLTGLRVSQYYTTHTSVADPTHVLAGSQDQGYQRTDQAAAGAASFDQLISGDYGHLTSSDGDHDWVYSVYPGFILVQQGETNPKLWQVDFPAGETFGWMPTVVADPYLDTRWFFCASHLYRYRKADILNAWTHVQWSTQDFAAGPGEHLTALAFAPSDGERAYAATNVGHLWHSEDHARNWTPSTSTGPWSHYFYGTALVVAAADADTVYVGGSGYGGPAVYRSTDGAVTFQPWGDGLPDTLVYGLAEAGDGTIFAATETAAYARAPGDAAWTDITGNDAPITTYWSVEWVPALEVVRFGTYGRGIWDYQLDAGCGWEAYGTGLGGPQVLLLDSASATVMGQPMVFDVTGAPPGAAGLMIVSGGPANLPAKGGTLLVDPGSWLFVPVGADGAGEVHLPATLPPNPVWAGLELFLQAVVADPSQASGWAFSNGLTGALCE